MTQSAPKYVAIFLTDYSEKLRASHGNYAEMSARAMTSAGLNRPVKVFDTIAMEYPSEEELQESIQAVWITGSAFDSYADIPWINKLASFIKETTHNHPKLPFVGICFGHQILSRALGAHVGKNPAGWEYGVHEIKLNTENEEIKELFAPFGESFKIQEVHQDVVHTVPEGLISIGYTERTKYQGFYKKDHIITFQGHPEFSCDYMYDLMQVLKTQKEEFTEEFAQQGSKNALLEHHGHHLSKLIVNHIEGGISSPISVQEKYAHELENTLETVAHVEEEKEQQ